MIYRFCRGIVKIINCLWFNFQVTGKENIPKEGSALLCPNHVSIYDPCVIAAMTPRAIHFMAKSELFENPFLRWLLINVHAFPVNREKASIETIKTSLKILKNQELLGIFPEGRRVKEGEQVDPAAGFIVFALKTKSPIIPIGIKGVYQFRKKIKIHIGKPIYLTEHYGKKLSDKEVEVIAKDIMKKIEALR